MSRRTNQDVATLLTNISTLLKVKGESRFKVIAYQRAAENITNLGQDLFDVWQAGELKQIDGIGPAIADKIDELFTTGKLGFWGTLIEEVPVGLIELLEIPDVGPKLTKQVWQELGITTVAELKDAAEHNRLQQLPRMGKKKEARILANIKAWEQRATDRVHLGVAWPLAQQILAALQDLPATHKVELAGSLRRMRESIGDLDILVATDQAGPVMAAFKELPNIDQLVATGDTKTSIRFTNGLQADLRCVAPERWGTALQYFTGSQNHNVRLRELAQKKGFSLNEYALTRQDDGQELLFAEETELYDFLGLAYIPPYLREDWGELEAARNGDLPVGLTVRQIKGEVHCHSTWSDGKNSIAEMAQAAVDQGYEYLAITDHSQSLGVANGVTVDQLPDQKAEIEHVREQFPELHLWHGIELEIRADGSLDYPDEVLADLDFVVASVHTGLRHQDRQTLTQRAIGAMQNPHVKLLAHPTGRLIGRREGGDFDMEAIFQAALETGTMLEINANPNRLDLRPAHVRRAVELGVKLIINCDAHRARHFQNNLFGVATANRGWATADDIANTRSATEFATMLGIG